MVEAGEDCKKRRNSLHSEGRTPGSFGAWWCTAIILLKTQKVTLLKFL